MKIYIVGMPGSGKSFLGRKIAQTLKLQFIDLDELIEKQEKKIIRTIIMEDGEAYFRSIERSILHETQLKNKCLISCGGGTPTFFDNMEWMKKNGIVIWINTPLDIISDRILKNITRRPLFIGLSKEEIKIKLQELSKKRVPFYKKASLTIDINKQNKVSLSAIIQHIIKYSKKINQ